MNFKHNIIFKKFLPILFLPFLFIRCFPDAVVIDSATDVSSSSTTVEPIPTTTNDSLTETTTLSSSSTTHSSSSTTSGEGEEKCTDKTEAYNKGGGTGDFLTPYEICTVEQLYDLSQNPEAGTKFFKLIKHLDFAEYYAKGKPSFIIDIEFSGGLDGNHQTISNYFYEAQESEIALFSHAKNAIFKDLNLQTFKVSGIGGVSSFVRLCEGCTITGITASDITVQSKNGRAGGLFVSVATGTYQDIEVKDLKIFLEIPQELQNAGGLAGGLSFFALTDYRLPNVSLLIDDVHIQGVIKEIGPTKLETDVLSVGKVGGILGHLSCLADANCELKNMTSAVNVFIQSQVSEVGGVVGFCSKGLLHEEGNRLNYSGLLRVPVGTRVGGIAGHLNHCTLDGLTTSINIEAQDSVGGLVGAAHSYPPYESGNMISDSHVRGNLNAPGSSDGFLHAGGLIGYMAEKNTLSTSSAQVSIESRGQNIGGLVGTLVASPQDVKIEDCFSNSIIDQFSSDDEVKKQSFFIGGIIGFEDQSAKPFPKAPEIQRVYSAGKVRGTEHVGGMIGGTNNNNQINLSHSFSVALVQSENSKLAAGITASSAAFNILKEIYWWSQNPGSTEMECFEGFIVPGCEVMIEAALYSSQHPVYGNGVWNFEDIWQQSPGALPTLK